MQTRAGLEQAKAAHNELTTADYQTDLFKVIGLREGMKRMLSVLNAELDAGLSAAAIHDTEMMIDEAFCNIWREVEAHWDGRVEGHGRSVADITTNLDAAGAEALQRALQPIGFFPAYGEKSHA